MTEPTPLDPAPLADAPLVVAAFLARYLADQEAAGVRPLAAYQALFPGHDALLAAEYARIVAGEPALEEVVGERLAGYRILGELGRGGQGVVYLALDERLGRKVALKVLPGAFGAAVARQRLLREAQAASRLDDPAICTVFDAGETGGIAYIAMRYVEGESLAARIARETRDGAARGEPARVRGLLLLFAAAARALHLAHEKGLVHRDIKPSNLMSDAEGKPVVLDFGLAHFDDHPDGTLTGDAVLGTPAYMSPEQLAAQQGRVDRRSDVFSLAVTLYEALTLQHPFAAPTRERLYQRVLGDEPVPVRRLVPALPADLDVVLACALDKTRDRRYATAQAFADDLQRIVERRPIAARPVPLRVQALRLVQRHPVASLAALVAIVGLVAFAALVASHNRQLALAVQEREVARQNAVHALHAEASARRRSDALRLASAATEVLPRDAELALLLSTEAVALSDDSQTRGALLGALSAFRPRPPLPGVSGAAWVRVSGDGTRVAVPVGHEVWLFDTATHTRVAVLACREARYAEVWWSSDARRLVLAADNQLARIVDGSATRDYPAFLCDGTDGRVLAPLAGHRGRLHAVVFAKAHVLTASGRVLEGTEAADARGEVRVWALADGAPVWQRSDLAAGVRDARFDIGIDRGTVTPDVDVLTDDGAYLRLGGADGATARERRVFAADERPRPAARLLPAGRVAVAAVDELRFVDARGTGTARVVPSRGGNQLCVDAGAVLRWSTSAPHALEFGGDQPRQVLPTLPQELIAVWGGMRTVARGEFHVSFATTTLAVQTVEAVFADGTVRSWRADTGEFVDLPPVGGQVVAAHGSETGEVLATVGLDGSVRVFAREGTVVLPRVPGLDESAWEALHPSGARALAVVAGKPTALDLSRGAAVWSLAAEGASWQLATYAPSGEYAAFGADDGAVWVVRGDDGARVATLSGNDQSVRGLAFSPDGRHVAVARGDLTVLDARTGAVALHIAPPVPLTTVLFAGGMRLVAAGAAGHRVFTFPEGAPGDGLALDALSARPGVPVAVAGDRVLLSRELAVPGHRVGGAGPAAILDARDGSVRELTDAAAALCWSGALAPDGARAVLPRGDGALLLVDVVTGSITELPGHDRAANCVRFSADGRCFASGFAAREFGGAHDERAVVVRAVDGGELLRVEVPSGVRWFDLDAAGEWLVVKAGDGELARYPVRAVDFAARLGLRALTPAERARYALAAAAPR